MLLQSVESPRKECDQYSKNPYIKTLSFEGCHLFLSHDYEIKYQAVRFLNRFLIYETVNINDNLNFYRSMSSFNKVTELSTVHVFRMC